jgi:hypothetical protein
MRLDLDAEVRFPEGQRAGYLRKIVIDDQNAVKEVVIETTGLFSRLRLAPVNLLSEGAGGVTYINCTPDQFDDLPEYTEDEVPDMSAGWQTAEPASAFGEAFPISTYEPLVPVTTVPNLPEGWVSVSQGTEIWCLDEPWGVVDQVLIDDAGLPIGIVGRPNDFEELKRLIPVQLVQQLDGDRLVLSCTLVELPNNSEQITGGIGEPEDT